MQTASSRTPCPLCRSASIDFVAEARGSITLLKCDSCRLVFHNGFQDESQLREYYDHYYREENLAFSPISETRFRDLLRSFNHYRQLNRILDIGCGSGHFLKVAIEEDWKAYGTEIAAGAFDQLSRLGINTFCGELEAANYPSGFFDVIYCSEVLEHVLEPAALLQEASRIVRPGGLLYMTTPNYNSLSRRLLGIEWRVIGKEHICYFTPKTTSALLRASGFSRVKLTTRNIDPYELRKIFSGPPGESTSGFQIERTEHLREQLETSRILRMAKGFVNRLLSASALGDTIYIEAEK